MPLYQYECPQCDQAFSQVATVDGRHDVCCPKCGTVAALVILGAPAVHVFEPHFNPFLNREIKNRHEVKVLEHEGYTNVGDASDEEVMKVAAEKRKHNEEERRKRRKEQFCTEGWQRHGYKLMQELEEKRNGE